MAESNGSRWVCLLRWASAKETALVRQKTFFFSCLSKTSTILDIDTEQLRAEFSSKKLTESPVSMDQAGTIRSMRNYH